jgi:hypothetical protein
MSTEMILSLASDQAIFDTYAHNNMAGRHTKRLNDVAKNYVTTSGTFLHFFH